MPLIALPGPLAVLIAIFLLILATPVAVLIVVFTLQRRSATATNEAELQELRRRVKDLEDKNERPH